MGEALTFVGNGGTSVFLTCWHDAVHRVSPRLLDALLLDELDQEQQQAFFRALELIGLPEVIRPGQVDVAHCEDEEELLNEFRLVSDEKMLEIQGRIAAVNGKRGRRLAVRLRIAQILRLHRFIETVVEKPARV